MNGSQSFEGIINSSAYLVEWEDGDDFLWNVGEVSLKPRMLSTRKRRDYGQGKGRRRAR
jgi:hypothetical protein